MEKIRKLTCSIDEYLDKFSINEILKDARLILESDDAIYRRALAGIIMASLDSIRISLFRTESKNQIKLKKEITALEERV